ncbi:hypothetical protein CLU79DRAFT_847858 [Phycomyces nitens]|nr:hypothetical protein CLU79DRAFT_847858 [Phycomyces nitens]
MASFSLCRFCLLAIILLQIISCTEAQFTLPGFPVDPPASTTAVPTTGSETKPSSTSANPPVDPSTTTDPIIPTLPSIIITSSIPTSATSDPPVPSVPSAPSVPPVLPSSATTPSAAPSSAHPTPTPSAAPSKTLSESLTTNTPSRTSSSSTPTSSASSDKEEKSNTPAIIGGVVGGVVGLALIGGLITFLNRRGGCTSRSEKPKSDFKDFEMAENDFPQRRAPTGGLQGLAPVTGSPTVPQLNDQGNFYNDHNGYNQNYSNVQPQGVQDGYYYDNYPQTQGYYTDGRYYYENSSNSPNTGYVPQQNYQQYQTSPPVQPMVAEYSKPDLADSKPHEKV